MFLVTWKKHQIEPKKSKKSHLDIQISLEHVGSNAGAKLEQIIRQFRIQQNQTKQVDTKQARRDLGEKHDDQQQSVRVDQTLAFLPGSTAAKEGHAEDDAA